MSYKAFKVGDTVILNNINYTVKYSWSEKQRFDMAKQVIRMESVDGAIWAGYEKHLNDLLNGLKQPETFKEIFGK